MANLKKSEIDSLLAEVEATLTAALKEEQEKLAKASPDDEKSDAPAPAPKDPEASTSPPPGDGDKSDASAPEASASASPDASAAPPVDASAPPADGSAPQDPAADVSNDPQALQDEYSKLGATDPEALKNHYLACKAALFALMGAGADASAAPAAPGPAAPPAPAASPAPPVASPSPDAPPAMKSEKSAGGMPKTTEEANGGQGMMKSENDQIKTLTEKLAKQEEAMGALLSVVTSVVETPVRKAITSVAHLAKTEEAKNDVSKLSRDEVKARLRHAAEKPLKKSDRELINSFDLGNVGIDKVAHLIGDVK